MPASFTTNTPPQGRTVDSGAINVPCNYATSAKTKCYSISTFVLPTREVLFIFDTHGASRHFNCTVPPGKSSTACTIEDSVDCAMITPYASNCLSHKEVSTISNVKFKAAPSKATRK